MKKLFLLLFSFIFVAYAQAQDRKYNMQEAVFGMHLNLKPETVEQLHWVPDRTAYIGIDEKNPKNPVFNQTAVPEMNTEELFSLEDFNSALSSHEPLPTFPELHWFSSTDFYFEHDAIYYKGKLEDKKLKIEEWIKLPNDSDKQYVDKTKKQIAYSDKNNLHFIDDEGNLHKITKDKDKDIVSGQIVSREEFGIDRGVFFSPKGNYVAFYQMDQSKVQDYPIIDWEPVPAENKTIKYPMAGTESQVVSLGIYDIKKKETTFLNVNKHDDDYLTNVTWGPEEKHIYVATFKRNQRELTLNQYDAKTGKKTRKLFTEKHDKYINPAEPLAFIPNKKNQFLFWSERDGFMHLYRYNTKGKLLNQVTSGDWVVNDINGWNDKEVIISSTKESAMNKNTYAVNWKNGKISKLDAADGVHEAKVSDDGKYLIDQYSNYETPNKIDLKEINGNFKKTIIDAENTLKDYAQPKVKQVEITAADGKTPLNGRLILPPDFDESKKYPVIVYLYAGPHVQLLQNEFPESGDLWYDYLAQRGYIVFSMDSRGSYNRGLEFEQATHKNLGKEEMKDQLKGVDYLKSLSYVDKDRLGIHGWSFGGYMTTSFLTKHPDVFKVGVAGGPVMDWSMYEIMYTERYMQTPEENPEGYEKTKLLDEVENLKGKLLLIHGAQDNVVVWQHSMRFLREAVINGKQVDYYVYPKHEHNVLGFDRIHLMQKVTDYFDDYLK